MKLYFMPLACSMATRITLTELGLDATFLEVDPLTKRASDGSDLTAVNPIGLVPSLITDDGKTITENIAVLMHLARGTALAPDADLTALLEWLGFIATELHKAVFSPLFDRRAPDEVRAFAVKKSHRTLERLDRHLDGREFLLEDFSVADAYLLTALNWARATPIDLSQWPAVEAYLKKGRRRPSVKSAIELELPLYMAEMSRRHAQ